MVSTATFANLCFLHKGFDLLFPVWSADPGPGTLPGPILHGGQRGAKATFKDAITSGRRAQTGRAQIRTAIRT